MAAVQTFKDLQDEVLRQLDEDGDTGTTLTSAKNFINQAQQARLMEREWPFMYWDPPATFTLVAGQRRYALHEEFFKPHYFRNQTSKNYLVEVPERELAAVGANWYDDTGNNYFKYVGHTQVRTQPSSASVITIVSSSAADTTAAKAITIRGETSTGLIAEESVTPTGTSSAATTTSFTKILAVTKAAAWVGTMTMTSNSAAVTNLVLSAGEFGRVFPQIELLWVPASTDTIEYGFWRGPRKLSADNDIPDIPPPFSQILVWDALILFAGYNTDTSEKAITVWNEQMKRWERAMQANLGEGLTLEAQPRFVRDRDLRGDYHISPSFY